MSVRPFTEEESAQIEIMWKSGMPTSEMGERLGGRSKNSIIGRVHRMNLPPRESPIHELYGPPMSDHMTRRIRQAEKKAPHKWSDDEVAQLRRMRADRKTIAQISQAMGLGFHAIRRKLERDHIAMPAPLVSASTVRPSDKPTRITVHVPAESVSPWAHCQYIQNSGRPWLFCEQPPAPRVDLNGRVITAAWCADCYRKVYKASGGDNDKTAFTPSTGSLTGHFVGQFG